MGSEMCIRDRYCTTQVLGISTVHTVYCTAQVLGISTVHTVNCTAQFLGISTVHTVYCTAQAWVFLLFKRFSMVLPADRLSLKGQQKHILCFSCSGKA